MFVRTLIAAKLFLPKSETWGMVHTSLNMVPLKVLSVPSAPDSGTIFFFQIIVAIDMDSNHLIRTFLFPFELARVA